MKQTVMIVDDSVEFLRAARSLLEREGIVVVGTGRAQARLRSRNQRGRAQHSKTTDHGCTRTPRRTTAVWVTLSSGVTAIRAPGMSTILPGARYCVLPPLKY